MKEYIDDDGEFGSRIKLARKAKGMSQIELATKVGISQQGLQRLEVGRVKSTRSLVQIAYFLGVKIEWLTFGEGEPPRLPTPASDDKRNVIRFDLLSAPLFSWEDIPAIQTLASNKKELHYFSLRIQDHSMVNHDDGKISFPKYDQLFFCNKFYLTPNNFVLAKLPYSSCLTFRQYVVNGNHYILKARNPRYKSVPVTDDVIILGRLIHRLTDFRLVEW
jgi:transcriptional regulator with XRE-family HTH domain